MALTGRDTILVVGSTMRLTRLLVTDDLGGWWVKYPAYRWASKHNPVPAAKSGPFGVIQAEHEWEPTWRDKIVMGLDCPFCVGTWVGFGVLAITAATSGSQGLLAKAWRFVMAGLTLNYLTAHISSRLDAEAKDEG